jgi:hypothetical protein
VPAFGDQPAEGTCGSYGTAIEFLDSPKEAAVQAKKENELVFVLHVSGNFEDPRFTGSRLTWGLGRLAPRPRTRLRHTVSPVLQRQPLHRDQLHPHLAAGEDVLP